MPSLKQKLSCLGCTLLLAIAGILTWRLGPWYNTSYDATSLSVSTSCSDCCNGLESNCDLPVNQILFPTVHNAHSSYENGFITASNNLPLEEALVAGYRGLMLESCLCDGLLGTYLLKENEGSNLGFCTSFCSSGVRGALEVLRNVKTFLEANPNEVLIVQIEITDNGFESLRSALNTTGLTPFIPRFSETYIQIWPTLRQLIEANTRLLLFANGDEISSCKANECPDGILSSLDHFSQTDLSDLESCQPTLSGDVLSSFFLMNHWKNNKAKVPSEKNSMVVNSMDVLEGRFEKCESRKRGPSFLAVDFWDVGDVLDFAEKENLKRGGVVVVVEEEDGLDAANDDNVTTIAIVDEGGNGTVTAEARSSGI
mmetsp:Transcript_12780/g.26186  ORF Transcript_12780/g.26186 Transcript_12780/m.26186 type:complete len:370 (-) Transcript_12780:282-1391(-)